MSFQYSDIKGSVIDFLILHIFLDFLSTFFSNAISQLPLDKNAHINMLPCAYYILLYQPSDNNILWLST